MLHRFLIGKGTADSSTRAIQDSARSLEIECPPQLMESVCDHLVGYEWWQAKDGQTLRFALFDDPTSVCLLEIWWGKGMWCNLPYFADEIPNDRFIEGGIDRTTITDYSGATRSEIEFEIARNTYNALHDKHIAPIEQAKWDEIFREGFGARAQIAAKYAKDLADANATPALAKALSAYEAARENSSGDFHTIIGRSTKVLKLDARARTTVEKMGVTTLADLIRYSEAQIMSVHQAGRKTLHGIKDALSEFGLYLGMDIEKGFSS